MRLRIRAAASLMLVGLLAGAPAGCGPSAEQVEIAKSSEGTVLLHLADLYRSYSLEKNAPPKRMADLVPMEQAAPMALIGVRDGSVKVFWGGEMTGLDDQSPGSVPSDKVLAYEATVPEGGGYVLMADRTVRKMTAEEFQSAPKAAETAGGDDAPKKRR